MARNKKGTFIIDDTLSQDEREKIVEKWEGYLDNMKSEVGQREGLINKRQDFFEGRHHKWTNVQGLDNKQQEGHILVVVNYISRFVNKLHQSLANTPPKIKIMPGDEADEIETLRAEMVEDAVYKVLRDNKFFKVVFDKCALNQVRDGDFCLGCVVQEDEKDGKHIEITQNEDMLKVMVGWDDASGSTFSFIAFKDKWSLSKIQREYGYEAEPMEDKAGDNHTESRGDHLSDQYGVFAKTSTGGAESAATGENKLPKAEFVDLWGYEVIDGKVKVINLIFINKKNVQFVITDYKTIPKFVGHSFTNAGKPWSKGFIDDLIDPQIELNDRTGEEGDLVRIGSHPKFLVVNMPDFNEESLKVGKGQAIFIEGEQADFRPLNLNITTFPSADYINRTMEHMFNIGLPKIALASGTAPYTGRVAAIQYQPIVDTVVALRNKWEIVMEDLIKMIQQYFIDYFPETHSFMREHYVDATTGEAFEGDLVIRDLQFDWDNVLPLSRSDKVVDASTMRDRHALSLYTYLEEAGYRNPDVEIKRLKKEGNDKELMTIMEKFSMWSRGAVQAEIEATTAKNEAQAEQMGQMEQMAQNQGGGTPPANKPLMSPEQNNERRGIASGTGTPTGQTASLKGAVAQATQNINAKAGV